MAFLHSRFNSSLGLSSDEMLEICKDIDQNFAPKISVAPPVSPSKFESNELLAISEEISRNFSPTLTPEDQPKLVILPVDPEHLYAYWNIPEHQIEQMDIKIPDHGSLTLRIFNKAQPVHTETRPNDWFDIHITQLSMHQKVRLPPRMAIGNFSATLGKSDIENTFAELVHSNHIYLPRARTDYQATLEAWIPIQAELQAILPHQTINACPGKPLLSHINQY